MCLCKLLAGRVFVDVILHQVCQMLLVEFIGQEACWTCVRFRRLISLTGWNRCNFMVILIIPDIFQAHQTLQQFMQVCCRLPRCRHESLQMVDPNEGSNI